MGDRSKVKVEFFWHDKTKIATEIFLLLHNVAYIPLLKRNLIYVSILDRQGYTFHFGKGKVDIFSNSVLIGNVVLHHGPLCDLSSINSVVSC